MKCVRMLTILFVAVAFIVCQAKVSSAAPMSRSWTYQGRLIDANGPADGLYDFEFRLFDDPCTGAQQGGTIDVNDLDVVNGYFTVELDFGDGVFYGDARWMKIAVRPGDSSDANDYTFLSPRQELTPTPYALYAENAGTDYDWMVSGNDMYSLPLGNVGIGTNNPWAGLHLKGTGFPNSFMYLQSDADEDTGFRLYEGADVKWHIFNDWENDGLRIYNSDGSDTVFFAEQITGNVGIGTTNPTRDLHIYRDVGPAQVGIVAADTSSKAQVIFGDGGGNKWTISSDNTDDNKLHFRSGHASGTPRVTFQQDGKVGIGTTSPASKLHVDGGCITGSMCSDIRLKKNIEPLPLDDSILDRVMGLQAVTFEWKHREDAKRQIGLIAQDVEEVFPEVVTTPDDGSCQKGLLATGLDAVIVESIKELREQIVQLQAQNDALMQRIEVLERNQ